MRNVNEDGTVTITGTPEVDEELTATLTDLDGGTSSLDVAVVAGGHRGGDVR